MKQSKEMEEFDKFKGYFLRNGYFREIKQFISQNFIAKSKVEEIVEMVKVYPIILQINFTLENVKEDILKIVQLLLKK